MPAAREIVPAPNNDGFTTATDVPLYWCAYGPRGAPRLLVLHGGPGAHYDYLLPQFLDLSNEYELVFYDQRGGGRSKTENRVPITWETHARDLECVVAELGLMPPTIVGYSWGGLLALLYAVAASRGRMSPPPSRMALIDPAPLTCTFRELFEKEFARRQQGPAIQRLRTDLAASGLRESDPDRFRQRAFEISVAGYFADPLKAQNLTPFRIMGRAQESVWASLGDYNLLTELHNVHCPTLIVHGVEDPIPITSSRSAAELLHAELVVLDACGHVPYVEARAALFSSLRSFLQRTSDSALT